MRKTTLLKSFFLMLFFVTSCTLWSQVTITTAGNYTQNFNTLSSSGTGKTWTDNSTITSWYTNASTYSADNGGTNTGSLYSYGTTSNSDRALGSIGSKGAGSFAYGVLLKNTSGYVITDIKVSYTGEQWRIGGTSSDAQTVSFYYKISSNSITSVDANNNSSWTAVSTLDFTSPRINAAAAAIDGNATANKVSLNNISIPSLNLPDGSYIMLKWDDPDHTGTDHGLAIDDVTISWTLPTTTLTTAESSVPAMSTAVGTPVTQKVTISGANLTSDVMLSVTGDAEFSVAPASITPTSGSVSSVEATITYSPTAVGTNTAVLTISSPGATSVVFNLSGTASVVTNVTDVTKSDLNIYKDGNSLKFNTLLAGETVSVYNSVGQKVSSQLTINGLNTINLNNTKGLVIVKVGNKTAKVVL